MAYLQALSPDRNGTEREAMRQYFPNAAHKAYSRLKRAILMDYSYHDLHGVNWKMHFAQFERRLPAIRTSRQFAHAACSLLSVAKDIHLWLRVGREVLPTYRRAFRRNVALESLPRLVPRWQRHNPTVSSGEFPGGIIYLCIRGWPGSRPRQLRPAYLILRRACAAARPIILDVRANGGGSEPVAARFASRFLHQPVCYAKHLTRAGGRFEGPVKRCLKPATTGAGYPAAVAVSPIGADALADETPAE